MKEIFNLKSFTQSEIPLSINIFLQYLRNFIYNLLNYLLMEEVKGATQNPEAVMTSAVSSI